jgi:hypothetical protein
MAQRALKRKWFQLYKDPVTGDIVAVFDDGSTQILTPGNLAGDKARAGQSAFDLPHRTSLAALV